MNFPCLIPDWALNADVEILLVEGGVNEDGESVPSFNKKLKCNLQFKSEMSLSTQKEKVRIVGKAYFKGDICPTINAISGGTLTHNNIKYAVNGGNKALNFDGSVNYTVLELM